VADELILVSTGASDWLSSSGEMTKVEGGYLVNAKKGFASGSLAGNIFIMSSCYKDPKEGWQVLHFPIPKSAEGVSIEKNWQAMGMRNTGSHMAVFEDVFVPEEAIGLKRPRGEYHPVWNVILTVAMPLIMSAYVGIAEAAADIVRDSAQKRTKNHKLDGHLPYLFGEMENSLITAQVMHKNMVAITNDFEFTPSTNMASDILAHKTVIANAVTDTTTKAIEAYEIDLYVKAHIRDLTEIWMGRQRLDTATRSGALLLEGSLRQVRNFPKWFSLNMYATTAPQTNAVMAAARPVSA